jgi:hypothetical protein
MKRIAIQIVQDLLLPLVVAASLRCWKQDVLQLCIS